MYIEKLEIKGFGKFEGKSLQFDKGVNIIYGSNESGKSTLQWFIRSMLYGLKGGRASKDGIPAPIKRFRPWSVGQFGGSMEYRLEDGSSIRVERNFDNNTVAVYDGGFNNITSSFDFSREKSPMFAEKQLGINEACFERTVLVRQMETRLDEEGRAELLGRVANISRTGSEDISLMKAQSSLREALKNYVGTERTRTSPIDKLKDRLDELKGKRAGAAEKQEFLMGAEAGLNSDTQEKALLCRTIEYMEQVKDLIGLRKCIDEGKAKGASLAAMFVEIKEAEKAVSAATKEYDELKEKAAVSKIENRPSDSRKEATEPSLRIKGSRRAVPVLPLGLLVCGLAAGGGGLGISPWLFGLAGVLLAVGLIMLMVGGKRGQAQIEVNTAGESRPGEDFESVKRMELKLKEIIGLKDVLKDLCEKASAVSGKQAGSAAQASELVAELWENERSLEVKLKTGIAESINTSEKVESEFFNSSRLYSFIMDSGIKWLEDSWNYEYEKLEEKLGELTLRIREHETILKNDANGIAGLQQLDEEIAELEAQKSKLEETGTSLKLALEVLEEAAYEIQRDYAPALNEKMSHIINKITSGRYNELKANDSSSLLTIAPENGSIAQIQVLSGGTVDQMYLALRLAAAELAFNGEMLPIMLDEAFSQYDDHRTMETLKYLSERYRNGQALLFTSKGREVELAEAACGGCIRIIEV